jgi:hypothetical protein
MSSLQTRRFQMSNATEKQLSYLRSLIAGRHADIGDAMVAYGLDAPTPASLSAYDASGMIEWLKAIERTPAASAVFTKAQDDAAMFNRALAGDAAARAALGW